MLTHEYARDYFVFSNHTHGSLGSMVNIESNLGQGKRLQVMTRILCTTAATVASILQTEGGVNHLNKATEIVERLVALEQAGVFDQLDIESAVIL